MKTYTVKEAAAIIGVPAITVYNWCQSGKIAHEKTGDGLKRRIRIADHVVQGEIKTRKKPFVAFMNGISDVESAWIKKYRSLIGCNPPRFCDFQSGKITFDEMKSDLIRATQIISE